MEVDQDLMPHLTSECSYEITLFVCPDFVTIIFNLIEWMYFKFGVWLYKDGAYLLSKFWLSFCLISTSCKCWGIRTKA